MEHILLVGINEKLFKTCYGDDAKWPCKLQSLKVDCTNDEFNNAISKPGLLCIVFQGFQTHYAGIKRYYMNGGFVAYFSIDGDYEAPRRLSRDVGIGPWSFSGTSNMHNFNLTPTGASSVIFKIANANSWNEYDALANRNYYAASANLIRAPEEERLMIPAEAQISLEEYIGKNYCADEEGYEYLVKRAPEAHSKYCKDMSEQSPLVLHEARNGGSFAFLGFIAPPFSSTTAGTSSNDSTDEDKDTTTSSETPASGPHIPDIVRAVLTRNRTGDDEPLHDQPTEEETEKSFAIQFSPSRETKVMGEEEQEVQEVQSPRDHHTHNLSLGVGKF